MLSTTLVISTAESWAFDPTKLMKTSSCSASTLLEAPPSPLSSRPERTRISYFALLATTTYAVFLKENRTILINATDLDRKSGGAQWRDLRFLIP